MKKTILYIILNLFVTGYCFSDEVLSESKPLTESAEEITKMKYSYPEFKLNNLNVIDFQTDTVNNEKLSSYESNIKSWCKENTNLDINKITFEYNKKHNILYLFANQHIDKKDIEKINEELLKLVNHY